MHKSKLLMTVALILGFAMVIVLVGHEIVSAGECRIIRSQKEKGGAGTVVSPEPATLRISKGTCVIWINWVPGEISINFQEDGKTCANATDAPIGFRMNEPKNCYLTELISTGATSSLRFNEPGTFNYVVQIPGAKKGDSATGVGSGPVEAKGRIIVQ